METMTRGGVCDAPPTYLLLAFELGERWWKLGFAVGVGQRPRIRRIAAGAVPLLSEEIARAKTRLRVPAGAPVISCYEAGRDGFWLHRYLVARGLANHVVDSSSIEVNRRARRAKTDRLDLAGLLSLLARYSQGDHRVWGAVTRSHGGRGDAGSSTARGKRCSRIATRLMNRLKGLLATLGVRLPIDGRFLERLAMTRLGDGAPIPEGSRQRLTRVWAQLEIRGAAPRGGARHAGRAPAGSRHADGRFVRQLQTVRAVGPMSAWVLTTEIFGWREIRNGRQLGALVGLAPAPYHSGETQRDQGITRAGNAHVRRAVVQLAWGWVRYQPTSALTLWYQRRFGGGSRRARKIGIVALARKLLVALWRYVETGAVPVGAQLKVMAG